MPFRFKRMQTAGTPRSQRQKWIKPVLIGFGSVLLLLLIGLWILTNYVKRHQVELLESIETSISHHISGELKIKSLEPALLRSFPDVSVQLDSVTWVDSLYNQHHLKTLAVGHVYVKLDLFSLFSGHPKIKKVTLADGTVRFFTLNNGYSNYYLLTPKKKSKHIVHHYFFGFENVNFVFNYPLHQKLFDIYCRQVALKLDDNGTGWKIFSKINIRINQLAFNLKKGGYLKDREVMGRLSAVYNRNSKTLQFTGQWLKVAHSALQLTSVYYLSNEADSFRLNLKAPSLYYKEGISFLPEIISKKLNRFDVKKPISVKAAIRGSLQYPDTPSVRLEIQAINNHITMRYGSLEHVSFTAFYNNYLERGKGRREDNSGLFIPKMNGYWLGIPFQADSATVTNLIHPFLKVKVAGELPSRRLNRLLGNSFAVSSGHSQFQLSYSGPVTASDTYPRALNGFILTRNTSLTYLPRNLKLNNCNATLLFNNSALEIKSLGFQLGGNRLQIHGYSENLLNGFFDPSVKVVIVGNIISPLVDLDELKTLLAPRTPYRQAKHYFGFKNKQPNGNFNRQLDDLLKNSLMDFWINFGQIKFKQFKAQDIHADLKLSDNKISLDSVSLYHAGGKVSMNAQIHEAKLGSPFTLEATLQSLKLNELFNAFNNFGQKTLKSENLKGELSAQVYLNGIFSKEMKIMPKSLQGVVEFQLQNGELNNFDPFLRLSKFIFKNRDLDHITFQTLSNSLTISGGEIFIPEMTIASSAITMKIQGIYSFHKGTDIALEIPLRNPQKEQNRVSLGLKPKKKKGIILYLRAKDGKDGKVHIGWDSEY